MRIVSLSVTEASRNFADCVNRARYQGTTFVLHKNGVAVARIVPERKFETEPDTKSAEAARPTEEPRALNQAAQADPKGLPRAIW